MPATIDLHCHSTVSDGLLSPEELVNYAHQQGVKLLALTDHDDMAGLKQARTTAQQHGMQFVNGVEISTTWKRRTLHIVGLHVNEDDAALLQAFELVRIGREQRAKKIGDDFARIGIHGAYEGAKGIAKQSIITRNHFAHFLVQNGHVKDTKAAFKRYLVKGKPGYVEHQWMSLEQAVTLIKNAGGQAVVAHPGRYDLGFVNMHLLLNEFRGYGGVGIEVVTGSHQVPQYQQFAKLAHRFGLKSSQGSDYHGPGISYMEMGRLPELPTECVPIWQDWPEAQRLQ